MSFALLTNAFTTRKISRWKCVDLNIIFGHFDSAMILVGPFRYFCLFSEVIFILRQVDTKKSLSKKINKKTAFMG